MSKRRWVEDKLAQGDRDFARADLVGADLSGLVLVHADLSGVDLRAAVLTAADLSDSRLLGADLRGAVLDDAICARTDLRHVDARHASFKRANLEQADFHGGNLEGADFAEAELNGTSIPLSCKGFRNTRHSSKAIFGLMKIFLQVRLDAGDDEAAVTAALEALAARTDYLFEPEPQPD